MLLPAHKREISVIHPAGQAEFRRHSLQAAPKQRVELGQFMTPISVAGFMASLFHAPGHEVHMLDAGAGMGALTAALVERFCRHAEKPAHIAVTAYELDKAFLKPLDEVLKAASCEEAGIGFSAGIRHADFIEAGAELLRQDLFASKKIQNRYTHAILNPPYRKIRANSRHRRLLRACGVETSNLYTGFLALTVKLLEPGGELVAIVPRSFCNGPYFKPFRSLFLAEMAFRHIHVFESRSEAFKDDEVLQENIIFHAVKGGCPKQVIISASHGGDFEDMTMRTVDYAQVVKPCDADLFIHIAANALDQGVADRISLFSHSLDDLGIKVSTGPVVDFRLKAYLRQDPEAGAVPLIYPGHFQDNFIVWPKTGSRKPNAIVKGDDVAKWLMPNGWYTLVRRFSAKEEKRRIVAAVYDPSAAPGEWVGFENHLNIFHCGGKGLSADLAKGLALYLNCALLDAYFRHFSGHTQVNATDLRMLKYPDKTLLERWGQTFGDKFPGQQEIEELIDKELKAMTDINSFSIPF
ncbi:MAG: SAM-dependent methyltransferase [Gammaproteobacteria bacterium]|nr:SAM-dependent methyltransferase [Gammaproteobacteria bacterium]